MPPLQFNAAHAQRLGLAVVGIRRHKDGSTFTILMNFELFKGVNGERLYSGSIRRILPNQGSAVASELPTDDSLSASEQLRTKIIGDYSVYGVLGRGTYGKVKLGKHRKTKEQVAVKILQKDSMDPAELERAQREIQIMKSLEHPNICRMYQVREAFARPRVAGRDVEKSARY